MKTAAFLDFDGVLCDSLLECYVSSYIGYYSYYLGREPKMEDRSRYREFRSLRPFIRRGADYLLLHKLLDEGIKCSDQNEFDTVLSEKGSDLSDTFHRIFYQVREDLLRQERGYWLSLNKLYEGLPAELNTWSKQDTVFILSTKKAEFIYEILQYRDIDWPMERIIYSGKKEKAGIIEEYMNGCGADRAFFIEDQIDHLKKIKSANIESALASWGYVQPEWLLQDDFSVLSIGELIKKMEQLLKRNCSRS